MNCHRLLLISVCTLLFMLTGIVDKTSAQPVKFGITGGVNVSSHINNFWFIEDDIRLKLNPKAKMGYRAGFMARKDLTQSLRLQAEPSISLMGARYDESFTLRGFEFQTESQTDLLYIQLPILLQLSTTPQEKTVFGRKFATTTYHITGGIFGGYLLDARFEGTNTGEPIGIPFEGDFSNDISSQYSDYDGGVILGIGFEHGERRKIGFEVRAQLSVFDSGDDPEIFFFKPENMGLSLSVYYLL